MSAAREFAATHGIVVGQTYEIDEVFKHGRITRNVDVTDIFLRDGDSPTERDVVVAVRNLKTGRNTKLQLATFLRYWRAAKERV